MRISKRREDPKQKDQIRLMFNSLRIVVDDRTIHRKRERERKKGMFNVDNRVNRKKKSSPLSLQPPCPRSEINDSSFPYSYIRLSFNGHLIFFYILL